MTQTRFIAFTASSVLALTGAAQAQSINLIQCDHIVASNANATDVGGTVSDSDSIVANNTLCVDFSGTVGANAEAPAGEAVAIGTAAQRAGVSSTAIEVTGQVRGGAKVAPTAGALSTSSDTDSNTQSRFFFDSTTPLRFAVRAEISSSVTPTGNDTANASFDFFGSGVNSSLNLSVSGTQTASGKGAGWIQPGKLYVIAGSGFTNLDADIVSGTATSVDGSASIEYSLRVFCAADYNMDGSVGLNDFISFLNAWNLGNLRADFNDDGTVDITDLNGYAASFAAGC